MMISKAWSQKNTKIKPVSNTDFEGVLSIEAIIFVVSEFLDEKDLATYMIVCKKMYQKIKSNAKIQIRVMNVKLLNARLELQRLKEDPNYREKRKIEQKEQRKWQADKTTEPLKMSTAAKPKKRFSRNFILNSLIFGNVMLNLHSLEKNITTPDSPKNNFMKKIPTRLFNRTETNADFAIQKAETQKTERVKSGSIGMINRQETQEFIKIWSPNPESLDYYSEKISEIGTEIKAYLNNGVLSNVSGKYFCPIWLSKSAVQKVQGLIN